MAGDWIKLEVTTPDKPEVVSMAAILGIDQDAVVGKCVRMWVWADQQTVAGDDLCIPEAFLDRLTHCDGFAAALRKVGWLVGREGRLLIPNFDRHNSQSAKSRAEAAVRQSVSRSIRSTESLSQDVTAKANKSLISRSLRAAVYKRDNNTCRYCGRHKDDPKPCAGQAVGMTSMSLDHVIPESRGGETTLENLVTACMSCNQTKSGRTLAEAGMRLRVCHTEPVTKPLPEIEKRRDPSPSISASDVVIPEKMQTPEVQQAAAMWFAHLDVSAPDKLPMRGSPQEQAFWAEASRLGPAAFVRSVEHCVARGWKNLRPVDERSVETNATSRRRKSSTAQDREDANADAFATLFASIGGEASENAG